VSACPVGRPAEAVIAPGDSCRSSTIATLDRRVDRLAGVRPGPPV